MPELVPVLVLAGKSSDLVEAVAVAGALAAASACPLYEVGLG